MTTLFIFLVGFIIKLSNAFPQTHGKYFPDRIVGGEDATQGEFPYQISLRFYNSHICGGSLVVVHNTQVILTAAHCVDSGSTSHYQVVAGDIWRTSHNINPFRQSRTISAIHAHQKYNAATFANDIAVLFISPPFNITTNDVKAISLPPKGTDTVGNITVTGWGTTASGGSLSDVLQKVQIPVVSDEICQQAYTRETILPSMLCAGYLGEGGKDSCQGDSGGPLKGIGMEGEYLAGIVSWGYGCAAPEYPGVNTEVSHFIDWIEDAVRSHKAVM